LRTKIKIKKLCINAALPEKATEGSAGYDLVAIDYVYDNDEKYHVYGTGLALELPPGYEAQIRPRSSIRKSSFMLVNSPGTIDSDYRGELMVTFKEIDDREQFYEIGDRIAQLIIKKVPDIELEEVSDLTETDRGEGGFGSSGS